MKVSELTGAELDAAVARAAGVEVARVGDRVLADRGTAENYAYTYSPSTDWAQGGPIIEREKISFVFMSGYGAKWVAFLPGNQYLGDVYIDARDEDADGVGPTPLIAAMRAYVASKFGEEVPDA